MEKTKYSDKQLHRGLSIVRDFSKDMDDLMSLYGLEREFQIYTMKVSFKEKESR